MSGTEEVEVVRAKCTAHTNALYIIRKQGCNAGNSVHACVFSHLQETVL